MSKFKVGDRIKISPQGKETYTNRNMNPWETEGTISCVKDDEFCYKVVWDNGRENSYREGELELVSKKSDNVNSPSHYGQGKIECIDYINDFLTKEEYIGYLRGNIAKYLHRWRYKNGIEDLKKANWYLDRLMWEIEGDKS